MTEAAQAPPTFKLVLVGDGGTGKVCLSLGVTPSPAGLFRSATHVMELQAPGGA